METIRKTSKESDPVELLAEQNRAMEKQILKGFEDANEQMAAKLGRKEWELQQKTQFLQENVQF